MRLSLSLSPLEGPFEIMRHILWLIPEYLSNLTAYYAVLFVELGNQLGRKRSGPNLQFFHSHNHDGESLDNFSYILVFLILVTTK